MNTHGNTNGIDRRAALGALGVFGGLALLSSRANGAVKLFTSSTVAPKDAGRSLVLIQLSGGNDGLSTIVPYGDDAYLRARPTLARKQSEVLPLDDRRAFHSSLVRLRAAYDAGKFAVVEGAGYPAPIRSHFKSMDVWHTADARGRDSGDGWIGKLCDQAFAASTNPNLVVHVGANVPYALQSRTHPAASFINPAAYRWAGGENELDAYEKAGGMGGEEKKPKKREGESSVDYLRRVMADGQSSSLEVRRAVAQYRGNVVYPPNDALGAALHDVAALLASDVGTRVLSVELSGFDTHTDQRNRHDALMKQLDGALAAFLEDLALSAAGRNAVVVIFSEFGRRVHENGSRGTDHGVAGPMFVLGHAIKGGLHGKAPALDQLDDGDLVHTTDFRSVYASVIEGCFGVAHDKVLGAKYPLVAVV